MTVADWVILGLWTTSAIAVWRPTFRHATHDLKPDDWASVVLVVALATLLAGSIGPLIAAALLFRATIGQRTSPETFAQALAGAPREERLTPASPPARAAPTPTSSANSAYNHSQHPESSMNHKALTLAITLALLLGPLAAEAAARSSWSHPA